MGGPLALPRRSQSVPVHALLRCMLMRQGFPIQYMFLSSFSRASIDIRTSANGRDGVKPDLQAPLNGSPCAATSCYTTTTRMYI